MNIPTNRKLTDGAIKKKLGITDDFHAMRFILRDGYMVPRDYGKHHSEVAWEIYPPPPYSWSSSLNKFIEASRAIRVSASSTRESIDECGELSVDMRGDLPVTNAQWRTIGDLVKRCKTTYYDIKRGDSERGGPICESGETKGVLSLRRAYEKCGYRT